MLFKTIGKQYVCTGSTTSLQVSASEARVGAYYPGLAPACLPLQVQWVVLTSVLNILQTLTVLAHSQIINQYAFRCLQ